LHILPKFLAGSEIENQSHYHYSTAVDMHEHVRYGEFDGGFDVDTPPVDFVSDFIGKLSKHQKRAILICAREGLLTDESFLNVSIYTGPDRIQVIRTIEKLQICVQVSMKKVVDIIGVYERQRHEEFYGKSFFVRLFHCCHLSSADFDYAKKADLDVKQLTAGRQKMPIYFTILFALMTLLTFLSHIWSNITNYVDIQKQSLWLSLGIVSIASLLIGALM
jgi:hypothetical protein